MPVATRAPTCRTPRSAATRSASRTIDVATPPTLGVLGDTEPELGHLRPVDVGDVHPPQDLALLVDHHEQQRDAGLVLLNPRSQAVVEVLEELVPAVAHPLGEERPVGHLEALQRAGVILPQELEVCARR